MFHVGRFLQLVGLGIAGIGCLIAFDSTVSEGTFFTFCLVGVVIFVAGHLILTRR